MDGNHKIRMQEARNARKPITHTIMCSDGSLLKVDNYTRKKAVAFFCTECEGWEGNVRDCTCHHCPLYPFRRKTRKTKR